MEQKWLSIKAKLDKDHFVEFADQEDFFIFLANTGGYEHLAPAYKKVTGSDLTTKNFMFYKAKQQRFAEILVAQKLTDGTSLLEFIKQKGKIFL